ncbi:CLUMA_CG017546, isoform A [Clunio marinus]|uniref:ubiquitinyl hydrolase 1 n=1 Tax=Clunio marinus TaxID=568069 RepID=A0A1J1IWC1_9DIPT|nr:CLUMA_CG017546, isoform A [Clunio marinus]
MSPPLTNFQTNTTSTTTSSSPSSNQSNNTSHPHHPQSTGHYSSQQIYPQMFPSGTVPLLQHFPIHTGYVSNGPPGQTMIPALYPQNTERDTNMGIQVQNDHHTNPPPLAQQQQHMLNNNNNNNRGRRGRARGGTNMGRRDYPMRHNNQHQQQQQQQNQQSSVPNAEYSQMEPSATALMSSGPYPQFYIHHHFPPYYGPPGGGPHIAALPGSTSSATAQNLTGQPLFAIQQPLHVYPYPFMYNVMPTQPHQMTHQQSEISENEHNQNPDSSGAPPPTLIQSIPWPHHVAFSEPHQQPIFQHSPHVVGGTGGGGGGEVDLEFTQDEYQMQIINHPSNFQVMTPNIDGQCLQQNLYVEPIMTENETTIDQNEIYQHESNMNPTENDNESVAAGELLIIEKTRDLMIQTDVVHSSPHSGVHHVLQVHNPTNVAATQMEMNNENNNNNIIEVQSSTVADLTNNAAELKYEEVNAPPTKVVNVIDNKMIVKTKEKPPAWGNPQNFINQQSMKKQTASVSVSAIPHKDSVQLQQNNVDSSNDYGNDGKERNGEMNNERDKQFPAFQSTFSTVAAATAPSQSKQQTSSKQHVDGKKTEFRQQQNETQTSKAQTQMALSERVKQQIVTTITGVGGSSQDVNNKKSETGAAVQENVRTAEEVTPASLPVADKVTQHSTKPSVATNNSTPVRATWAELFMSSDTGSSSKPSSTTTSQSSETTQKQSTIPKTHSEPTIVNQQQQPPQLLPGVMSYSAVSAQSVTVNSQPPTSTVTATTASGDASDSKILPQNTKLNEFNNNSTMNVNHNVHSKSSHVDQHAMKLGDFFSKYKIESSSVSLLPRGLLNKSNYCYINAILQALVACPPFYHLMKAIPQMSPTYRVQTKTPVTDAMVELVSNYSPLPYRKWVPRDKMNRKEEVPEIIRDSAFEPVCIFKMLQALRTEMFPVEGRQEDAEEFLSFILNRMNDEMIEVISGTRNKSTITRTTDFGRSPISDIFGGKLRLRVHREGDHSSDNIEPFFTLKLVIEKATTVREALEILVGRDQLEGVTCSRTNQEVVAWQQVTLEELPVVLILHLKCFDFKKDSCTKILKTVEFPVELKLDPKIIASKNKYQQKQKQYKLFAVVYHDGKEASKGHYITDVFHVGYSSWIRYDDSTVKAVPEANVLNPKSPRVPYLLYYRRYDTIGANREQRDHNCNNHQNNQKSTK